MIQVAIPLMKMTSERVDYLYDLMDAAYDADPIYQVSRSLGHVPIIKKNRRRREVIPLAPHEAARYRERTVAERFNSRLKEEFGGGNVTSDRSGADHYPGAGTEKAEAGKTSKGNQGLGDPGVRLLPRGLEIKAWRRCAAAGSQGNKAAKGRERRPVSPGAWPGGGSGQAAAGDVRLLESSGMGFNDDGSFLVRLLLLIAILAIARRLLFKDRKAERRLGVPVRRIVSADVGIDAPSSRLFSKEHRLMGAPDYMVDDRPSLMIWIGKILKRPTPLVYMPV